MKNEDVFLRDEKEEEYNEQSEEKIFFSHQRNWQRQESFKIFIFQI